MTDPPSTTTTEMPMEERVKRLQENGIPYFGVCTNESKVITDPKKIYGYYRRTVIVENPVDNVTVENNTWLKHGDMCVLNIKFVGTGPFSYCFINFSDVSRADENCEEWQKTDVKLINYHRFFPKSSNSYTLVTFIRNEVSMIRHPIGIQFYDGKIGSLKKIILSIIPRFFLAQPRSQLSVIIVPVVFTLVAVVLIVFGVAYYVQNRNQFLIEVADFNFGETQSIDSLEYKSFLQRLLDSISDLFIRNQYNEDLDSPGPETSNQNYQNMP